MMLLRFPRWLVATLLAMTLSCRLDTDIPATAVIICDSNAHCPTGYQCSTTIDRCVPNDVSRDPPAIVDGSVVLTPTSGRVKADTTVTIQFMVDRQLARKPEVVLGTTTRQPFAFTSQDELTYTFELFSSLGTVGQWPILVTLVDTLGNVAPDLQPAFIWIDFQAPQLVGALGATPSLTRVGQTSTIPIAATEDLLSPPVVELQWPSSSFPPRPLTLEQTTDARTYHFSYTAVGDEPEEYADVVVALTDLADNSGSAKQSSVIGFDFTGPQVLRGTESLRLIPAESNLLRNVSKATFGTNIELFLAFDEPNEADPVGDNYPIVETISPERIPVANGRALGSS